MDIKRYGSTNEETGATDSIRCRQIIKSIIEFGVNEQQKLKLIYLLALELENRDHLQEITALAKRCESDEHKKSTLITDIA